MISLKMVADRTVRALSIFYRKLTGEYQFDMLVEEIALKQLDNSVHTLIKDFLIGAHPSGLLTFYMTTGSDKSMDDWYTTVRLSEQGFGTLGLQLYDMCKLSNQVERHCNITLEKYTYVNLINLSINKYVTLVKKTYLKQYHA